MTSAEIRRNIQYNENYINSYQNSIRNLENQISQLQQLRGKVQSLQNNFGSRQAGRKSRLSSLFSIPLNVKMVSKYQSAMYQLLTGSEYNNAYHGLSAAQDRINSRMRGLQNEINACNGQISYYRGRVSYWRNQLRYAQDK